MRSILPAIALLAFVTACDQRSDGTIGSRLGPAPVVKEDADLRRLKDQLPQYWAAHLGKGPMIIPTVYDHFQVACAVERPVSPADHANGVSRVADVAVAYVYQQPSHGDAWKNGGTYNRFGLKEGKWWLVVRGDDDLFDPSCQYGVSEYMGGTRQEPVE